MNQDLIIDHMSLLSDKPQTPEDKKRSKEAFNLFSKLIKKHDITIILNNKKYKLHDDNS